MYEVVEVRCFGQIAARLIDAPDCGEYRQAAEPTSQGPAIRRWRAKLYAFFGRPKGGPLRVRHPQKCLPQTCIVWGRQGEAVGFDARRLCCIWAALQQQHAARLLQRNVRFAAAQHSLCSVSRAFWCYASQQGMGRKRRVSACASLHHCHWDWHSGRICIVVVITRGGEWDSFGPNALTCSARQKSA